MHLVHEIRVRGFGLVSTVYAYTVSGARGEREQECAYSFPVAEREEIGQDGGGIEEAPMVAQLRRHLARHQVPSPFSENARQSRRHCVCVRVCVCVPWLGG